MSSLISITFEVIKMQFDDPLGTPTKPEIVMSPEWLGKPRVDYLRGPPTILRTRDTYS